MNSRAMTPQDIEWVVNIMSEDQTLFEKRKMFCFVLGLSSSEISEFDSHFDENSGTLEFFRFALNSWISKSTDSGPTIESLIRILISGNFCSTADKIRQRENEIVEFTELEEVGEENCHVSESMWFDVPEDYHNGPFTGRSENLNELHESLIRQNTEGAEHNLTVLSGVGGVGKTSLTIHYALKFMNIFYKNVIWINSETQHTTADSFCRLARKLKRVGQWETNCTWTSSFNISEIVSEIYDFFQNGNTLIVFDNVESHIDIEPYIPFGVKKPLRPYFLITSRNSSEWGVWTHLIELNVFKPEESIEYFKGFLNMAWFPDQLEAYESICSTLQNLPLAIRQASAYIKMRVDNIDLLKFYLRLLLSGVVGGSSPTTADIYESAVHLTWTVTMETLKEQDPLTKTIMELISYFNSENIPIKLLYNIRKRGFWNNLIGGARGCAQKSEIDAALKLLSDFFLVTRQPQNIDTDAGVISIHKLLRKIIRDQIEREYGDTYLDWFINNVINFMENPLKLNNHDYYEDLCLIHALSIKKYIPAASNRLNMLRKIPFIKLIEKKQRDSIAQRIISLLTLFNEEKYDEMIHSFAQIKKLFTIHGIQGPISELFIYEFVGSICKDILDDTVESSVPGCNGNYDEIVRKCKILKDILSCLKISFLNFDDPHDLLEPCEEHVLKLYRFALDFTDPDHTVRTKLYSMIYMVLRISYVRRRYYRYLGGINRHDYIMLDCLVQTNNFKDILKYLIDLHSIPVHEFYYSPEDNLIRLQGVLAKILPYKNMPEILRNVSILQSRIYVTFLTREKLIHAMKCVPSVIECQISLNKPSNTLKMIIKLQETVEKFIEVYWNNDDEFGSGRDVYLTLIDSIYKASDHPNSITIKDQLMEIALGMQTMMHKHENKQQTTLMS